MNNDPEHLLNVANVLFCNRPCVHCGTACFHISVLGETPPALVCVRMPDMPWVVDEADPQKGPCSWCRSYARVRRNGRSVRAGAWGMLPTWKLCKFRFGWVMGPHLYFAVGRPVPGDPGRVAEIALRVLTIPGRVRGDFHNFHLINFSGTRAVVQPINKRWTHPSVAAFIKDTATALAVSLTLSTE